MSVNESGGPSRRSTDSMRGRELRRTFKSFQISMIVLSTTVGVGFFSNAGEILAIAGPASVILSFFLVGLLVCFTMDGMCEMAVLWPVSNPMIQFIKYFIDRELAIVVGFAYWYTYCVTIAGVVATAGELMQYWNGGNVGRVMVFIFFPLTAFFINFNQNQVFAWIEFFGGCAKFLIIFILAISMYFLQGGVGVDRDALGTKFISDGFQHDSAVESSNGLAFLVSLPLSIFSFIGVESVTVTASEALNPRELRHPAKWLSYYLTFLYLFTVISFTLNVPWQDPRLPPFYAENLGTGHATRDTPVVRDGGWTLPTIAIQRAGSPHYGGIVNGCLLYSAFSLVVTNLFVASRTLHGLGTNAQTDADSLIPRFFARFSRVTSGGVPAYALLMSLWASFLPFLCFLHNTMGGWRAVETQQILTTMGSYNCVLVWSSQCVVFIRYWWLFRKYQPRFEAGDDYGIYNRKTRREHHGPLGRLQPLPAIVGLVGSITTALCFSGIGLRNSRELVVQSINIYLGPVVCIVLFIVLKALRAVHHRSIGGVTINTWADLRRIIDTLSDEVHVDSNSIGMQSLRSDENLDNQQQSPQRPPQPPPTMNGTIAESRRRSYSSSTSSEAH